MRNPMRNALALTVLSVFAFASTGTGAQSPFPSDTAREADARTREAMRTAPPFTDTVPVLTLRRTAEREARVGSCGRVRDARASEKFVTPGETRVRRASLSVEDVVHHEVRQTVDTRGTVRSSRSVPVLELVPTSTDSGRVAATG